MAGYFHQPSSSPATARKTYRVDADLLRVMSTSGVPERLRPLARELGVGSAMSAPDMLLQDLVNFNEDRRQHYNVSGPATAALLGGSVSLEGDLEAPGVTFSVSGGLVGFVTFAIPAALLLPGGGFYVAYRLFRLVRDSAALKRYARISRAAPHIAAAVAISDHEITREEARLLRDLVRGRVGSPTERHALLAASLDSASTQPAAIEALSALELKPEDWSALLLIAVATAHADDVYTGRERAFIGSLRELTPFTVEQFWQLASEAEAEYALRCHLGEAMVRACHQIARAGSDELPDDATLLMDIVLSAAVPGDAERVALARRLTQSSGPTAMSADELARGASSERPSLFRRVAGARSERIERADRFGETLALFVATLEQWRGWVVRDCRRELIAIGTSYGLSEKYLLGRVRRSHRNIRDLRREWIRPVRWQTTGQGVLAASDTRADGESVFHVTGHAGGRFVFHRGETRWEWRSAQLPFDEFCREHLSPEITEIAVRTDEVTFELLEVTVDAHDSERRVKRVAAG